MGRRPKPTHLKLVQGNPGKRALNAEAEPREPRVLPPAPDHMTVMAKEAWYHLAPLLDQMGILTAADLKALEMACEAYAEVRECRDAIELAGGGTYETRNLAGEVMFRARPEAARLADADRRFRGWLIEFGLTPAARSKVRMPGGGPDPLDRYFTTDS